MGAFYLNERPLVIQVGNGAMVSHIGHPCVGQSSITSCRMQVSTDRGQDCQVKPVAACPSLSCDQVVDHFPYCPNNTRPHVPQSAVRHSYIPFPPLPINMKYPSWFVCS